MRNRAWEGKEGLSMFKNSENEVKVKVDGGPKEGGR